MSNRGVHLLPFGYHGAWMAQEPFWTDLLAEMGMAWAVVKSDSSGFRDSGAPQALLERGINAIVRFDYTFPYPWTHADETSRLVEIYARYGAKLHVQFGNEPYDDREWKDNKVPTGDVFWSILRDRWNEAARQIAERGAYPIFPDGPGYSVNPFPIIGDPNYLWTDGIAEYGVHAYGHGRPEDYPYDDVSQYGTTYTVEQYRADLDDFADDPNWNHGDEYLVRANAQRKAWAKQGKTIMDDDTCFMAWEKILIWSREAFGLEVPICMTEGGWTPRDRAGSVVVDERWALTTPQMVARKTLAMYDSPMFAVCPWLLASEEMGGVGWPDNCWRGYAYSDKYGMNKPVIDWLIHNQPDTFDTLLAGARADLARARALL